MLDTGGFNQLCKGKHGYFLYNRHDTFVGRAIATYGEWSEEEIDLLALFCRPGDTVVEAGSNIGTHTVPLAKNVGAQGRVHAFEAQRLVFQTLCANVALNSLPNVECHHVAVGAQEGQIMMPEIRPDREENFGGIRAHTHPRGRKLRQVALDGYLPLAELRLLKADIEGMELELVQGARELITRLRPLLYLESEPAKATTPPLLAQLLAWNYTPFWHVPRLFNPHNFAGNAENIFGNYASFNLLCLPQGMEADAALIQRFRLKRVQSPEDKPF